MLYFIQSNRCKKKSKTTVPIIIKQDLHPIYCLEASTGLLNSLTNWHGVHSDAKTLHNGL